MSKPPKPKSKANPNGIFFLKKPSNPMGLEPTKNELRTELSFEIQAFLDRGGEIQKIPYGYSLIEATRRKEMRELHQSKYGRQLREEANHQAKISPTTSKQVDEAPF